MAKFLMFFLTAIFFNLYGFQIDKSKSKIKQKTDLSKKVMPGAASFFEHFQSPFSNEFIATNPYSLLQAAQDTLNFIHSEGCSSKDYVEPRHFKKTLPYQRVESTLKFIINTIKSDMSSGKFRILDPNFLNKNFHFVHWKADSLTARSSGVKPVLGSDIRLTSYAIFNVRGSAKKTSSYPCALYQALDAHVATRFTKQQILAGILDRSENKKLVRPLVWLSRDDFEDALMQGTIIVSIPNGKDRVFVSNVSNNIEYDKKETDPRHQKRFWFFIEDKNSKWSIEQFKKRLKSRQNVIFAGDIFNIGIGKVIAIKHTNPITRKREIRLGVLADTGGAFARNLYQLDLFAGLFNSRTELSAYLKNIPVHADAYILYR